MEDLKKFNYAKLESKQPIRTDKQFEEWHDLIDIKVPLGINPEILLCPRVIKPLWHQNPRSILTQIDKDWWDRTRQKVYASNNFHCCCCGVHKLDQRGPVKYLDAHEYYDINYQTGEVRLKYILALCRYCHSYIHFGRLFNEYESGNIEEKEFYAILSHGNTLLQNNNLPPKNLDPDIDDNIYHLDWDVWNLTLTIEGEEKKFYSLYKNEEELNSLL